MTQATEVPVDANESKAQKLARELANKKAAAAGAKKIREDALEEKWLALQILAVELEEKFESELGRRGDKWDMFVSPRLHADDGIFVVKRPDKIAWNTYEDSDKTKTDAHHLVLSALIYPADQGASFNKASTERPALVWHVSALMGRLVGVEVNAEAGK